MADHQGVTGESDAASAPESFGSSAVAVFLAWWIPGAGHFYLKRRGRAAVFFTLILTAILVATSLGGDLYTSFDLSGGWLKLLATACTVGLGIPFWVLWQGLGYQGDPGGVGYEYGTSFMLTAALMNLLLVLDVWDIARGHKE